MEIPINTICTYISNCTGCGCGCAGHTTYCLVKNEENLYEYIFDAKMKFGSATEYSYQNVKPTIRQIKIVSFKEFYEAFNTDDQYLLKCFDNYYQDTIFNSTKKYYDVYRYNESNFEFTLDIVKCLTCYKKYCSNLTTELKKYQYEPLMKSINVKLKKENIDLSIYLINEETDNSNNKNYLYYFRQ